MEINTQNWEEEWKAIKANFLAVKNNEWWASDEDYIKSFIKSQITLAEEREYDRGYGHGTNVMTARIRADLLAELKEKVEEERMKVNTIGGDWTKENGKLRNAKSEAFNTILKLIEEIK
jgi:hypothetical protein